MHELRSALLLLLTASSALAAPNAHPLDPLSGAEMRQAVEVLRQSGKLPEEPGFPVLTLREPPKEEVYGFREDQPFRREAFAVVLDRAAGKTYEAVVDLRKRQVVSYEHVPDVQPLLLLDEYTIAQDLVRKDPRWQEAMRRRGISELDQVALEPWAVGYTGTDEGPKRRLMRVMSFFAGRSANRYARPIEGVLAVVDVVEKRVLEVTDSGIPKGPDGKPAPVPPETGDYDSRKVGPLRVAPRPLTMTQPQGPSFSFHGNEVRWQKWRFRPSVQPREGLVLHLVGYEDRESVRPVLYRASLSEIVVPYGDPDGNWRWRDAFDVGEYGVGLLSSSLVPGVDVPAYATFIDAVLPAEDGSPRVQPRAVAIYERDGGLLWRHRDYVTDVTHGRRARQLAVSFTTAVGNYDYMLTWVFQQDGALSLEVDLSGIMLAKGVGETQEAAHMAAAAPQDSFGHLVAPNVSAVHHQHFLLFRLDLDVDGQKNSVLEMNSQGLPKGGTNPLGNAFTMTLTPLRTEEEARREVNLGTSRRWLVVNPERRNALGAPPGYLLLPGENALPFADPEAPGRKRAAFTNHHLWVTRFNAAELYGAGDYPNQREEPGGLPVYAGDDQAIEGQDVVLWYTLGVTHVPRPEEWPIMVSHRTGFSLLPAGFFARNPSLDVPPTAAQLKPPKKNGPASRLEP